MGNTIDALSQTAGNNKSAIREKFTPLKGIGFATSGHTATADYGYLRQMKVFNVATYIEQRWRADRLLKQSGVLITGDWDNSGGTLVDALLYSLQAITPGLTLILLLQVFQQWPQLLGVIAGRALKDSSVAIRILEQLALIFCREILQMLGNQRVM